MSSYATPADLQQYAMPASSLADVSTQAQQASIDAQSTIADGYLSPRYVLPLKLWGTDLTFFTCQLTEFAICTTRGIAAETESYQILKDKRDAAIKWFEGVRDEKINPVGLVDSAVPATTDDFGAGIYTETAREW